MIPSTILLVAAAGAVVHLAVMIGAMHLVQPVRDKLARVCSELLTSEKLNEEQKTLVENYVDTAFNPWFVFGAAFCAPFLIIFKLFGAKLRTPFDDIKDAKTATKIDQMIGLQLGSLTAANPYFMFVLFLELILFLPVYFIFRLLGRTQYTIKQHALRVALLLEIKQGRLNSEWHLARQ